MLFRAFRQVFAKRVIYMDINMLHTAVREINLTVLSLLLAQFLASILGDLSSLPAFFC